MSAAKGTSKGRSGGVSRPSKQARKNAASRRAAAGRAVTAGVPGALGSGTDQGATADSMAARGAHPELDFRLVLDYFSQHGTDLDAAFQQFLCEVDPTDAAQQDAAARRGMSRAFAEWFVFDHRLVNDRTPLEHFCAAAPMKTDRRLLDLFRQVAATQLFSLFWVRAIDAETRTVTFEDVADGRTYEVYDGQLGASLSAPGGLMAVRLAQAAGEWRCPCEVALYRDGEAGERLGTAAARLAQVGQALDLLDIVHLIYGIASDPSADLGAAPGVPVAGANGPAGSPAAVGFAPRPADPSVTADAGSPGIEVPPERRSAYLDELQRDYERLAQEHGLTVTWDDMATAIKTHDGDSVAHDVVERLFGTDAAALGHLDDAAFGDLMGIFLGAWNLLPHDYLDGRSPAEVYQSRAH